MDLGSRLVLWRKHRGLTQAQLADKAGVSRAWVNALEKKSAKPTMATFEKIVGVLELTVEEFYAQLPPERAQA